MANNVEIQWKRRWFKVKKYKKRIIHGFSLFSVISSPEPKAHSELLVYKGIRRPSVVRPSFNIFKRHLL